jgi:hypothetical protein
MVNDQPDSPLTPLQKAIQNALVPERMKKIVEIADHTCFSRGPVARCLAELVDKQEAHVLQHRVGNRPGGATKFYSKRIAGTPTFYDLNIWIPWIGDAQERTIRIPAILDMERLSYVIQAAFGLQDQHDNQYNLIAKTDPDAEIRYRSPDLAKYRFVDLALHTYRNRIIYTYDYSSKLWIFFLDIVNVGSYTDGPVEPKILSGRYGDLPAGIYHDQMREFLRDVSRGRQTTNTDERYNRTLASYQSTSFNLENANARLDGVDLAVKRAIKHEKKMLEMEISMNERVERQRNHIVVP